MGPARIGTRPGVALLNVLMFTILTTIFLISGIQFVTNSNKMGRQNRGDTQCYNVALAGINHAVSWLRKQSSKPVYVFDPKANTTNPEDEPETPLTEEQLGLVSEFVVDGQHSLWGRYEVGRSKNAPIRSPGPSATGAHKTSLYPEPPGISWTAEDVGAQRGLTAGKVWRVRSRGYVYEKTGSYTFATVPKKRVVSLEAEIRMGSILTRAAAIYAYGAGAAKVEAKDPNALKINLANGTGKTWWTWTNDFTETGTVDKTGLNAGTINHQAPGPDFVNPSQSAQLTDIFGTSDLTSIQALADKVVDATTIPQPMPLSEFVYIKGDVKFDQNLKLDGSGILFVEGKLEIDSGTAHNSTWNGLIYSTSDYKQKNKSTIVGGVISGGKVELKGEASGKEASLSYSASDLALAGSIIGDYRLEHSTLRVLDDSASPQPL